MPAEREVHSRPRALPAVRTDADVRADRHEFIRDPARDALEGSGPSAAAWEIRATARYDALLFKEFAICDLSRWASHQVGLRWRTEAEVCAGKGEAVCAELSCEERGALTSLEVVFKYAERGERKQALVKCRLCRACAAKMREAKRESKAAAKAAKKKTKRKRRREAGAGGEHKSDVAADAPAGGDVVRKKEKKKAKHKMRRAPMPPVPSDRAGGKGGHAGRAAARRPEAFVTHG